MRNEMKTLLVMVALVLNACGKDESENKGAEQTVAVDGKQTPYAMAKRELPECNDDNQDQLVYLIADETFYTCDAGEWNKINIKMETKTEIVKTDDGAINNIFWHDKKTELNWYIKSISLVGVYGDCRGGDPVGTGHEFDLINPTVDEIKTALKNGMMKGVNARVSLDQDKFVYSDYPDTEINQGGSINAFRLCIVK